MKSCLLNIWELHGTEKPFYALNESWSKVNFQMFCHTSLSFISLIWLQLASNRRVDFVWEWFRTQTSTGSLGLNVFVKHHSKLQMQLYILLSRNIFDQVTKWRLNEDWKLIEVWCTLKCLKYWFLHFRESQMCLLAFRPAGYYRPHKMEILCP